MNSNTAKLLNMETMINKLANYINGIDMHLKVPQWTIGRNKAREVFSIEREKNVDVVYDKRFIVDNYLTKPFGF